MENTKLKTKMKSKKQQVSNSNSSTRNWGTKKQHPQQEEEDHWQTTGHVGISQNKDKKDNEAQEGQEVQPRQEAFNQN